MRRGFAIARATALEMFSEPLSLLIFLTAVSLAVFAPTLHYHAFGEAERMARDSGFSALMFGTMAFGVFGVVRSFRREVETGTLSQALAHSVGRGEFLLAKFLGAAAAAAGFATLVFAVTVVIVNGAAIGGEIAAAKGDVARLWGPSLALGWTVLLVPLLAGAFANRFFRARFTLTAFRAAAVCALASLCYRFDGEMALRYLPVAVLMSAPSVFFTAVAASASVRLRANAALAATLAVFAATLPELGNYTLHDALAGGGSVNPAYVLAAVVALVPAVAAALLVGAALFRVRDIR